MGHVNQFVEITFRVLSFQFLFSISEMPCMMRLALASLVKKYRLVAVEEHPVKFMIRNKGLAKLASDRAIIGRSFY